MFIYYLNICRNKKKYQTLCLINNLCLIRFFSGYGLFVFCFFYLWWKIIAITAFDSSGNYFLKGMFLLSFSVVIFNALTNTN